VTHATWCLPGAFSASFWHFLPLKASHVRENENRKIFSIDSKIFSPFGYLSRKKRFWRKNSRFDPHISCPMVQNFYSTGSKF
jgi:hypothetical protein